MSNRFNLTFSFPEMEGQRAGTVDKAEGSSITKSSPGPTQLLRTVLPANATEASRIVIAKHRDQMQDAVDEAQQ